MARARTGSVETRRRADGSRSFIARIRLADGSRERVLVTKTHSTPAGGRSARERAELYAPARQEREDEAGELFVARSKRKAEEERAEGAR